jgi:hypothetical protein
MIDTILIQFEYHVKWLPQVIQFFRNLGNKIKTSFLNGTRIYLILPFIWSSEQKSL